MQVENPIVRLELSWGTQGLLMLKLFSTTKFARLEQIEKGGFKHFMLKEIMVLLLDVYFEHTWSDVGLSAALF